MQRNILRLVVTLSLLMTPWGAAALGQINVDDVIAGYDGQATLTGAQPGESVEVHVISPSGQDTVIPVTADASGGATVAIPSALLPEAGTYRIMGLSGETRITPDTPFEVVSDRVDAAASTMSVDRPLLTADGQSMSIVTVTLKDAQGNPLQGRPVRLIGSRVEDRIMSLTADPETDAQGQQHFSIQTQRPGEILLRAMDLLSGTILEHVERIAALGPEMSGFQQWSPTPSYPPPMPAAGGTFPALRAQVTGGSTPTPVLAGFRVEAFEGDPPRPLKTAKVGQVLSRVVITAIDKDNNPVDTFMGTVEVKAPLDPHAELPLLSEEDDNGSAEDRHGEVTFKGRDRGVFVLALGISFSRPGEQVIEVTDKSGTVRGTMTITVSGKAQIPDNRRIVLESPRDGDAVPPQIVVKGSGPKLRNLKIWAAPANTNPDALSSGTPIAEGDIDDSGRFSVPVTLPNAEDVILQVQSGPYDSGIVRLRPDLKGPTFSIGIEPENPHEGEDITFTVRSEPGLRDAQVQIADSTLSLTETEPGTYTVITQASSQGDVAYTVSANDAAGNTGSADGVFRVLGPDLPVVRNLRAQPLAGGIALEWDPIPDETISNYRIEVGKLPTRTDFTLDTPEASDNANIQGLRAGTDYFLSVRALRGDQVGPRSEIIPGRTLGMEIAVSPQESSLLLQWTFPDTTPLLSFILEYGEAEGQYSEKRTLDGAMRANTMTDLLPLAYYIRLTPVTTTGTPIDELAVTTTGTPLTPTAFRVAANEEMPPSGTRPPPALHGGAPATAGSGLPFWFAAAVAVAAAWGVVRHVRRKQLDARSTQAFLDMMQMRYRG